MYQLFFTTQFKKDLKKLKKRPVDLQLATSVLKILQRKGVQGIPAPMRPHRLIGKYSDLWECHIKADLLIIWLQIETPGSIRLIRIGSHSELFR